MISLTRRLRALVPSREKFETNPWLRVLAPYFAHPKLWHWSRRGVAAGTAIGLFFGLLIPCAQIPLAAATAIFFRANLPVAATGTLITTPLTFPPIYYAAYHLGAWATSSSIPPTVSLTDTAALWENIGAIGMPLFTGLGIMAIFAAITGYLLISQVWIWRVASKRRGVRV